jgi:hypothetical protein
MRSSTCIRIPGARGLCVALLSLLLAAAPARAGVSAALSPALLVVAPDSTVNLELDVTAAGSAFNAFTAVIGYDPAALTFLPGAPTTTQRGCLMTGTCSSACGLTFHQFSAAGDSLVVQVSLLCDSISLNGPGQLYKLRFRASPPSQTTYVRVRSLKFYNAGRLVTPVTSADSRIDIVSGVGVGPAVTPAGLRVGVTPNPARGTLSLSIAAGEAGEQSVDVLDAAGRLVRHLDRTWQAPGTRTLHWDGTDGAGRPLPAGIYLARVRAGSRLAQSRIVLLH